MHTPQDNKLHWSPTDTLGQGL